MLVLHLFPIALVAMDVVAGKSCADLLRPDQPPKLVMADVFRDPKQPAGRIFQGSDFLEMRMQPNVNILHQILNRTGSVHFMQAQFVNLKPMPIPKAQYILIANRPLDRGHIAPDQIREQAKSDTRKNRNQKGVPV